jgi:hypothetical protein
MNDLERAIQLIKLNDKDEARHILKAILRDDRDNEQAWLAMLNVVKNKGEYRRCVQEVLRINPNNAQAQELAQKHNIEPLYPIEMRPDYDPDKTDTRDVNKKIAEMRAMLAELPPVQSPPQPAPPASMPRQRRRSRGCVRLGAFIIFIALIAGLAAIILLSRSATAREDARQTENAEIEATNHSIETEVSAEATTQFLTLTAPPAN